MDFEREFIQTVFERYGFEPMFLIVKLQDNTEKRIDGFFIKEVVNGNFMRLLRSHTFNMYKMFRSDDDKRKYAFLDVMMTNREEFKGTFITSSTTIDVQHWNKSIEIIKKGRGIEHSTVSYQDIDYSCVTLQSPFEDEHDDDVITLASESLWEAMADKSFNPDAWYGSEEEINNSIYDYLPEEVFQMSDETIVDIITQKYY